MDILLFLLGTRTYALPLERAVEVVRAVAVTPLARAPLVVMGVINVRGEVVPVLDVRRRFGLPEKPLALSDRFVLIRTAGRVVALRADEVVGVETLARDEVRDLRTLTSHSAFIAGVAPLGDRLVLIHDPDAFLSEAEALTLAAALESGGAA